HLEYTYIPIFDKAGKVTKVFDIFADVTALVEKINESESLIKANPASILTVEPSGKILSVNPSFIAISHLSEEKLLSMKLQEFNIISQDGLPLSEILSNGEISKGMLVIDFGWSVRTLDFTYIPVRDANDTVTSLVAMYIDVTEQVSRLDEMESFLGENPHAIMTLSPEMEVMDVNPAFCIISGYSHDQAVRMQHKEFKSTDRVGATAADAINNKKAMGGKITCLFPAGIRHLEYTYIPIFDKAGKVTKVFDIFADVTALMEKITESDSLIKENPASIMSLDIQGNILSVNKAFLGISHISEDKLLTMNGRDLNYIKRDGPSISEVVSSKLASKGRMVVDFGWAVKTLDYTYIPVLDANDAVTSIVAMYIDVSDQVAYVNEIEAFIRENPHAIMMMDTDMRITEANPACSKMLGYSHEDITRMKLTDMTILEREGQTIRDALQTKQPARGKVISETPAGIRHLDYVYIPIMDQKGTVIRFIEIFSDMTAIRSLVQYLNKSVEEVQNNISSLAKGDTTFNVKILDADEYSASAREEFVKIGQAIDTARKAITHLVKDSNAIANAAIAGDLKFRSDSSVHEGDYREIIEGMNKTLDSINIPIVESMKVAGNYANYNFTTRFDPTIDIKGDWIQFKKELNNIGIQISEAISLINKSVSDLASSAEEANASIEEVLAGAHQIAANTGKVSQNADQGGDGIVQVLKAMEDLNETVSAVSQKTESVSVASNETNSLAKGGITLAKQSEKAMGDITTSTNEVNSIVNGINSQMDEIGKIVRLISDIANQTNLLALNAAIEAARAGEAGRGFAVVAAEVKSLAQDSRKSAENIADMIATLQTKANQATQAMGKSTGAVKEGSSALEQTLTAFNKIANTIEEINQNIVEVASASEEQAASVEEVTASIQEVANLVQNTSREAGDAAAATEEASASIDEVGRIMGGVVRIVENISGEMTKFKVA
ncbi:MAG TPA: methyl-accepting chemotaxis protein, partial [Methanospirillum sp.]|uniref:methyl-accepting chemotaxis protein n=1 Tax=Methanospirillum sp. TaxID=45200 RepID=UPI002C673A9D